MQAHLLPSSFFAGARTLLPNHNSFLRLPAICDVEHTTSASGYVVQEVDSTRYGSGFSPVAPCFPILRRVWNATQHELRLKTTVVQYCFIHIDNHGRTFSQIRTVSISQSLIQLQPRQYESLISKRAILGRRLRP